MPRPTAARFPFAHAAPQRWRRQRQRSPKLEWSLRSGFVNRGEETVPAPRNCLNESRVVGRVAEGNAQFPDGGVDALIETDERESGLQLLARNYVSGTLQKHRLDPKRVLLQRNFPPTLAYCQSLDRFRKVRCERGDWTWRAPP
jgi:hypothetical protein